MTCPTYYTTNDISLFYCDEPCEELESRSFYPVRLSDGCQIRADSDCVVRLDAPTDPVAVQMAWKPVPITSESLDAIVTTAVSEQITSERSFRQSKAVGTEILGEITAASPLSDFFTRMLQSVLQAPRQPSLTPVVSSDGCVLRTAEGCLIRTPDGPDTWEVGRAIQNGSDRRRYAFLKRVRRRDDHYDFYLFRGCEVDSVQIPVAPASFVYPKVSIIGLSLDKIVSDSGLDALPNWTFEPETAPAPLSGSEAVSQLVVRTEGGSEIHTTFQNFTLALGNEGWLRHAVGKRKVAAVAAGFGRFSALLSGTAYYTSPTYFQTMLLDRVLSLVFSLTNDEGAGLTFSSDFVKVLNSEVPKAASADQDLLIQVGFQFFESGSTGTLRVLRHE